MNLGQLDITIEATYHKRAHALAGFVLNPYGQVEGKLFKWRVIDQSMVNARSERIFGEKWSV